MFDVSMKDQRMVSAIESSEAVRLMFVKKFVMAIVLGILSPILLAFVTARVPYEPYAQTYDMRQAIAVGSYFLLGVALLYRNNSRIFFARNRDTWIVNLISAFLWVVGLVGSGWCYGRHVCMGGHMDHPPYAIWHYTCDAAWVMALVAATIWSTWRRASISVALCFLSVFLLTYRFVFGSFGGRFGGLPL